MKKQLSFLILTVLCISCIFVFASCTNSGTDESNHTSSNDDISLYNKIAQNIECNDYEAAIDLCNKITTVSNDGKDIVMNALTDVLNAQLESTMTSYYTENDLVNDRTINKFKQYKEIVDKMQITDNDYTNVVRYIDLILSTEEYTKYEPLWCLINGIKSDLNNATYYFNLAQTSYGDTLKKAYAQQSLAYYEECYSACINYSSGSFGIAKTREVFKFYVDELTRYVNYGKYDANSKLGTEWNAVMDEASAKWEELLDIIEKLPTSIYYGE